MRDKTLDGGSLKALELDPWLKIAKRDADNEAGLILSGTRVVTILEQQDIVQPAWNRILALPIATVDTLFSWLAEKSLPG